MSSRKKKSSGSASAAAAVAPAPSGARGGKASSKETSNNWGWGRPCPPPAERDVFAFEACPWKFIIGMAIALPTAITYAIVGVSWWALLLLPVFGALLALPVLAATLLPLSWQLDPAGPGCPEKFFKFNDKGNHNMHTRSADEQGRAGQGSGDRPNSARAVSVGSDALCPRRSLSPSVALCC